MSIQTIDRSKQVFSTLHNFSTTESRPGSAGEETQAQTHQGLESRPKTAEENGVVLPHSYKEKFYKEFCQGSGINPDLHWIATEYLPHQRINDMGDVEIPLYEALGFHYSRFGHQVKRHPDGIGFKNEDGSYWQAKLDLPKSELAKRNNKPYLAPKGNGSRAYLPALDPGTREKIGERLGKPVPPSESFWKWVEASTDVPIELTEGGKKALSALTQGYVGIALYGCNSGYRKLEDGTYELIKDLKRFAESGRLFRISLDQDSKPKTRKRVAAGIWKLATLLEKEGCRVKVVEWNPSQGKGIDDVIVQSGVEAFERAVDNAVPFSWWKVQGKLAKRFTKKPDVILNVPNLVEAMSDLDLLDRGVVAIKSGKKTCKTGFLNLALKDSMSVISLSHRRALAKNLANRLDLTWIEDADLFQGRLFEDDSFITRLSLCIDSIFRCKDWIKSDEPFDLVLDEATQVIRHLLTSATTGRDGIRPLLLADFEEVIRNARRIFLADADLDNATIDYIKALRGEVEGDETYIIRNDYLPATGKVAICVPDEATALGRMIDAVCSRKRIFVATDTLARSISLYQKLTDLGFRGLLINSATTGSPECQEYINDPTNVQWKYDFVVGSPSIATGISIEGDWCEEVFGFFSGWSLTSFDVAQILSRVRNGCSVTFWEVKKGRNFSKVSRHTDPIQLLGDLKQRTDMSARLVKSSLSTDSRRGIEEIDYVSPHYQLFAQIEADRNWQQWNFCAVTAVALKNEGWQIIDETENKATPELTLLLREVNQRRRELLWDSILSARKLDFDEVAEIEALKEKGGASESQLAELERYRIENFYSPIKLTRELLEMDKEGRLRGQITNAKLFHDRELNLAEDLAIGSIAFQEALGDFAGEKLRTPYTAWDFSDAKLKKETRIRLKLDAFFESELEWHSDSPCVLETAKIARENAPAVKLGLNLSVNSKMTDIGICNQLLEQIGYKRNSRRPTINGKRVRVYSLDLEWKEFIDTVIQSQIERWHPPLEGDSQPVHPPSDSFIEPINRGGGQEQNSPIEGDLQGWTEQEVKESLADYQDVDLSSEELDECLAIFPSGVAEFIRNKLALVAA